MKIVIYLAVMSQLSINSIELSILLYILSDAIGLEKQCEEGSRMGFTGKQAIHPGQIGIIQKSFSPPPEKVEWAEELLKAYENCNEGVFVFRGQMIDMPTILQAQNIGKMQKHIEGITSS